MSHVALLIPTIDRIGGAERQVLLVAQGLRARGWRVSVIALSGAGGVEAAGLAETGVGFLSLEMRKGLADVRGWLRLNGWLQRERPEIAHAHMPHAAWMARWSRLAAPVRVGIDTIHTSATGTPGRRLGYRWSRWLPDCVTAVGEGVREAYVAAGMVTLGQCRVIPNGVDTEVWKPDASVREALRGELSLRDEFLWLAAGRLETVKDYATMLAAFARMPETARLAIAGNGPLEDELKKLASALAIAERVRFLGFVPDVRRWMQAADGFLLTSRWEGLPMGLIEAAACGLPAVATDVPGTREVIADGETGLLVPAGSTILLSDKMRLMMQAAHEDRRAMGERARKRVMERFSLTGVLDQWEALYGEMLERNAKARRRAGGC